jgi:hypothetical protein
VANRATRHREHLAMQTVMAFHLCAFPDEELVGTQVWWEGLNHKRQRTRYDEPG